MKIAIYPGSFDPITLGHMDIIKRAAAIFDRVIVCIMDNSAKKTLFTKEERVELVGKAVATLPNVEVDSASILLGEYARGFGKPVIIKGLRAVTDFEYEFQMAIINKKVNPDLDTLFLTASEAYTFLSSTMVREMAFYGASIVDFVPSEIIEDVLAKFK